MNDIFQDYVGLKLSSEKCTLSEILDQAITFDHKNVRGSKKGFRDKKHLEQRIYSPFSMLEKYDAFYHFI